MRRSPLWLPALFLTMPGIGCHTMKSALRECADACPGEEPATVVKAPAPKIEIETPDTIVVKAPAPKVVYEQPCGPQCPPQGPGFGGAPQGPGFGGAPQQPSFGAAPPMMMAGYGAAPGFVNGEVKENNSIGLMFTSLRINIPWLRLRLIPEPSEVTIRGQAPNTFGAVPVQGFGTVPMVMPGFGGAPMQQGFGGTMGGQTVYMGTQYVPMQGMQAVQVPTGGVAGGNGFGTIPGGQNFGPPQGGNGFGAAPAGDGTAEAVEKLKQKLKECEELQNKLKSLPVPKT